MSDCSAELVAAVEQALADETSLSIVGGGSKLNILGRTASSDTLQTLEVGQHSGIIDYHPAELVLCARAGTSLTEINATLAKEGQMLAFEPPTFADHATLGGTLACNMSGPARPWSGSIRDMVLGVQLINGKAELLNFGGQVMKNVAGYDVSRLQAGALGTLGLITQVSLKVMPLPEHSTTLIYEVDAQQALQIMNERRAAAKPLNAACWVQGNLYLRLSGAERAVTQTAKIWGGQELSNSTEFWRQIREMEHPFFATDDALWRISQGPTAALQAAFGDTLLDWGGAQRWVRGEQLRDDLEKSAEAAGGHAGLYRGGDRTGEVNHRVNTAQKGLHQRLKHAFDPAGVFNPGRLYSWM
jgi:glycolate oxidase FAD binding subunit